MKQITAIFQPHRLEHVEQALHAMPQLPGFTIHAARGHARGRGTEHRFDVDEWNPASHTKLVLTIFCADALAAPLVSAIERAAHTGQVGDGMVAVTDLAELVRIRTGERGDAAV
ncbi:MAG: transcriptional regulator [Leptothrix sp. (in: Bacteria)]|nr:transcriptional regulator [Leptothrix sp. (in: b-proteobacteria)]